VVDHTALAIGSVHPEPDRLTINPLVGRDLEVLTALLPYYDGRLGQMGDFFGAPGLRLRPDGQSRDYWELGWLDETGRDRGTQLRIRRPPTCCPRPLGRAPMASQAWKTSTGSLRRCGTPTLGPSAA
jgi:hypothetical protein